MFNIVIENLDTNTTMTKVVAENTAVFMIGNTMVSGDNVLVTAFDINRLKDVMQVEGGFVTMNSGPQFGAKVYAYTAELIVNNKKANTVTIEDIYKQLKEWAKRYVSLIERCDMKTVISPIFLGDENGVDTFTISVHNDGEDGNWYTTGTYTLNEYGEEVY